MKHNGKLNNKLYNNIVIKNEIQCAFLHSISLVSMSCQIIKLYGRNDLIGRVAIYWLEHHDNRSVPLDEKKAYVPLSNWKL